MSQLSRRRRPNEPHDLDDPLARSPLQQRQQQDTRTSRQPQYSAFSSSSGSLPRSLRRTSHFEQQQLPRSRSASIDSTSRPQPNVRFADSPERPVRRRAASATDASGTTSAPHPALRISPHTASAILYALEVGLRNPNPFTPDLIEENASMSDLTGGSRAQNGAPRSATSRGGTSAQAFRTPTEIMKNRRAREAAKEARERGQLEPPEEEYQSARQDEDRIRTAERRFAAPGVAAAQPAREPRYPSQDPTLGGRTSAEPTYAPIRASGEARRAEESLAASYAPSQAAQASISATGQPVGRPRGAGKLEEQSAPPQVGPRTSSRTQQPQTQAKSEATGPTTQSGRGTATSQQPVTSSGSDGVQKRNSNVSSFPHAFERWETLSSRWEGLTSYWISRLEQNTKEIRRDPERQQMSRQITDLSAAGANLFHAVVELQRLRASSERKFQRWFFETRDQQEQSQQTQAQLQRMLEDERRGRAEDNRSSQQWRNNDRLLQEYRRELQISKDEARRAWEELGRREQAERERILSLREGHPIEIGGVQVLPTNAPSRGGSLQRGGERDPVYPSQATPSRSAAPGEQEYGYTPHQEPSPTDTDPFSGRERAVPTFQGGQPSQSSAGYAQFPLRTGAAQPGPSSAGPSIAASQQIREKPQGESPSARFYSQPNTFLQGPSSSAAPLSAMTQTSGPTEPIFAGSDSDDEPGYEVDENGEVRFDSDGNPISYRGPTKSSTGGTGARPFSEGPETGNLRAPQYAQSASTEQAPEVTQGQSGTIEYEPADYEGEGYGAGDPNWEGISSTQRHHHPTRLSDVLEEEDERSRTSGRASRGSGGMF